MGGAYLEWALADFSGYIAADELYDGPFCVLSIVDNHTFKRLLYQVLDHDPEHTDIEAFLRRFDQALEAYEIDPEVVRIARDSGHFTFLTDTPADTSYHVGDGRLELAGRSGPPLDLLVLDAFSGDAIPVHLLTVEAFDLYRGQLADGGAIAVHISNRYLDLRPVVAGAAEALGLATLVRRDPPGVGETDGSWWAVVAEDEATLAPLRDDDRWRPTDEAGVQEWTDERSNLLAVLGVDPPG